jgi:hypothetical protein
MFNNFYEVIRSGVHRMGNLQLQFSSIGFQKSVIWSHVVVHFYGDSDVSSKLHVDGFTSTRVQYSVQ